ncbi:hypothetical protein HDU82_000730, partial [Entophlyctis luteolus]
AIAEIDVAAASGPVAADSKKKRPKRSKAAGTQTDISDIAILGNHRLQLIKFLKSPDESTRAEMSDGTHWITCTISCELADQFQKESGFKVSEKPRAIFGIDNCRFLLVNGDGEKPHFELMIEDLKLWGAENCGLIGDLACLNSDNEVLEALGHGKNRGIGSNIVSEGSVGIQQLLTEETSSNDLVPPDGRHYGWGDFELNDAICKISADQQLKAPHIDIPEPAQPIGYVPIEHVDPSHSNSATNGLVEESFTDGDTEILHRFSHEFNTTFDLDPPSRPIPANDVISVTEAVVCQSGNSPLSSCATTGVIPEQNSDETEMENAYEIVDDEDVCSEEPSKISSDDPRLQERRHGEKQQSPNNDQSSTLLEIPQMKASVSDLHNTPINHELPTEILEETSININPPLEDLSISTSCTANQKISDTMLEIANFGLEILGIDASDDPVHADTEKVPQKINLGLEAGNKIALADAVVSLNTILTVNNHASDYCPKETADHTEIHVQQQPIEAVMKPEMFTQELYGSPVGDSATHEVHEPSNTPLKSERGQNKQWSSANIVESTSEALEAEFIHSGALDEKSASEFNFGIVESSILEENTGCTPTSSYPSHEQLTGGISSRNLFEENSGNGDVVADSDDELPCKKSSLSSLLSSVTRKGLEAVMEDAIAVMAEQESVLLINGEIGGLSSPILGSPKTDSPMRSTQACLQSSPIYATQKSANLATQYNDVPDGEYESVDVEMQFESSGWTGIHLSGKVLEESPIPGKFSQNDTIGFRTPEKSSMLFNTWDQRKSFVRPFESDSDVGSPERNAKREKLSTEWIEPLTATESKDDTANKLGSPLEEDFFAIGNLKVVNVWAKPPAKVSLKNIVSKYLDAVLE